MAEAAKAGNTTPVDLRRPRPLSALTVQIILLLVLIAFGFMVSTISYQQKVFGVEFDVADDPSLLPPLDMPVVLQPFKSEVDNRTASIELSSQNDKRKQPSLSECLALNSADWIKGPRLGNTRTGNIDFDAAINMILPMPSFFGPDGRGSVHALLRQTICHEKSAFLNYADDGSEGQMSADFWALRLIY